MRFTAVILFVMPVIGFTEPLQDSPLSIFEVEGVQLHQINEVDAFNEAVKLNSAAGVISMNTINLRSQFEVPEDVPVFINLVHGENWAIRNWVIPSVEVLRNPRVYAEFDLGNSPGEDVTSFSASISAALMPLIEAPSVEASDYTVLDANYSYNVGMTDYSGISYNQEAEYKSAGLPGITLVETAVNQDGPMAVGTALSYLTANFPTNLTKELVFGLCGDGTLLGDLGVAMDRFATERTGGFLVDPEKLVSGTLRVALDLSLSGNLSYSHRGRYGGDSDIEESLDSTTITSRGRGSELDYYDIYRGFERGANMILGYSRNGETRYTTALAGGLVYDKAWWYDSIDYNQASDNAGFGLGVRYNFGSDTNQDGYLNRNGTEEELDFMYKLRYRNPFSIIGPARPDTSEADVVLEDIKIKTVLDYFDVDGHASGGFVDKLPDMLHLTFSNDMLKFNGAASWLGSGITTTFTDNSFSGSGEIDIPGFNNVKTDIIGDITQHRLYAKLTVGSNGVFPGGNPFGYEIEIEPKRVWPWNEKEYEPLFPKISLLANGFAKSALITSGDPVRFDLSLRKGSLADTIELWIVAQVLEYLASYNLGAQTFIDALQPTYTGNLIDLDYFNFFNAPSMLPAGDYTIHTYLDPVINATPDLEQLYGGGSTTVRVNPDYDF